MQAMATNKRALIDALAPWEQALQEHPFLAGSRLSLADLVAMADLRTAFEKVRMQSSDEFMAPTGSFMAQHTARAQNA
jgi:glutathione S-transferase